MLDFKSVVARLGQLQGCLEALITVRESALSIVADGEPEISRGSEDVESSVLSGRNYGGEPLTAFANLAYVGQ